MEEFIDLHVHTCVSDSTFSPERVVEEAIKQKFRAISITDHDAVDGIDRALQASEKHDLEIVPGIEFSTDENEKEIHILGYFIDWKNKELLDRLAFLRNERVKRAKEIIDKLGILGVKINFDRVLEIAGQGVIGRMHIAQAIKEAGYIVDIRDAFRKYLANNGPAYVKKYHLSPQEAIEIIKNIGGVSVLAHPSIIQYDSIIPKLAECGLCGIEAYRTEHSVISANYYKKIAEENNLIVTGGSDCHGLFKGKMLLGTVKVPYEVLEKLKQCQGK